MNKKSIAVIGQGFVGGSLTTVMSERGIEVYAYDKAGKLANGGTQIENPDGLFPCNIKEFVTSCEKNGKNFSKIYFVCVPTPMYEDGSADLSIVEGVLEELSQVNGQRIAVVKSTVPPGSTEIWNEKFGHKGLHIIFNPEFLTERSALEDMRKQNKIILGGPRPWINDVKSIFGMAFAEVPIIKTSSTTAETVKYLINNFLTVKVAFANEVAQICEAMAINGFDVDYDKVIEYAVQDSRIGKTHWNVPGPDGFRGFGGHCFPKDINAMINYSESLGVDAKIIKAAWQKNLEVRPKEARNWESMVGRAVSFKPKESK